LWSSIQHQPQQQQPRETELNLAYTELQATAGSHCDAPVYTQLENTGNTRTVQPPPDCDYEDVGPWCRVFLLQMLFMMFITGCTVVHYCKGDQPFQWENLKFNLPYIPLNFSEPKFAQIITSGMSPDVQNLVKIR